MSEKSSLSQEIVNPPSMPNAPSHKYHHGNLYDELIIAGSQLIKARGVDALSLRDVAKEVGVSHTAPYRHFKDKNSLMMAIAQKNYDILGEDFLAIHQSVGCALGKIKKCCRHYVEFMLRQPEFASLMFSGRYKPDGAFKVSHQDTSCFQILVRLFEEAFKSGSITDAAHQINALNVWTSAHGLTMLIISGQIQQDRDAFEPLLNLAETLTEKTLQAITCPVEPTSES